ncbi:MAG: hypothetical protein Q9216_000826 [Gyalolechia sp. 2 TL-2023]
MRPLFPAETRRRLREENPRWYIKATLQAVCAFLAFPALVLFAHATALTNRHFSSPHGDWTDWMPLFPVLISLIYNPIALALPIFRYGHKSIHPGWDVGVYLFVWALGIPSMYFCIRWGWFWWWQPVFLKFNDFIPCNQWNYWSEPCNPVIYTAGKIEIAANVFLGLLIILSLTLFVLGCIAVHKHRRAARRSRITARNIQLQYHRSPDEHAAQQPPAYTPPSDGANVVMPGAVKYS